MPHLTHLRRLLKAASLAAAVATASLFGTAATATNLAHVKTVSNIDWTSAGVGGMRDYGFGNVTVCSLVTPARYQSKFATGIACAHSVVAR